MSAREFEEWRQYYKLEPFGDDWAQTRANAASNLATCNPRLAKDLHKFFPAPPKRSDEDMEALMEAYSRRHNARLEHKAQQGD